MLLRVGFEGSEVLESVDDKEEDRDVEVDLDREEEDPELSLELEEEDQVLED